MSACDWPSCDEPSVGITVEWEMCTAHTALHYALEGTPTETLNDAVRDRIRAGQTDRAIAADLHLNYEQVRGIRRRAGIARNAPAGHGTRSGYSMHRRRGEVACGPCKAAQATYDAGRWAARKQRDRAS